MKRKASTALGVSFQPEEILILAARRGRGPAGPPALARVPGGLDGLDSPGTLEAFGAALERVAEKLAMTPGEVRVIVPGGLAIKGRLEKQEGGRRAPALEPDLEALTPYPAEELFWDVSPPAPGRAPEVLAARKEPLLASAGFLEQAGLTLLGLDTEPHFLAQAWRVLEQPPGLYVFLRREEALWCVLPPEGRPLAGQVPANWSQGPAELLVSAVQQAADQWGTALPGPVFLAGPAAVEPGVAQALTREGGVEEGPGMVTLDPEKLLPEGLDWDFLPLLGISAPGAGGGALFNLWPVKPPPGFMDSGRATLIFGLAALILGLVWLGQDLGRAWMDHSRAQARLEEIKTQLEEVRAEKKKLTAAAGDLAPVARALEAKRRAAAALADVAGGLPPQAWLKDLAYDAKGLELTVLGLEETDLEGVYSRTSSLHLNGKPVSSDVPGEDGKAWTLNLGFAGEGEAPAGDKASAPPKGRGFFPSGPAPGRPASRRPVPGMMNPVFPGTGKFPAPSKSPNQPPAKKTAPPPGLPRPGAQDSGRP